jgi:hypothetical protein
MYRSDPGLAKKVAPTIIKFFLDSATLTSP